MKTRRPRPRGKPVVNKVLEVTLAQLAEVGLERLSVPEVARLAGVNKTSVYRRWPTREDLVRAALEQTMQHTAAAPDTGSLRGDLLGLVHVTATFLESAPGRGAMRVLLAEGDDLGDTLGAPRLLADDALPAAIRRAVARGELPRDTDVKLVLFTLAGALMHRTFVERAPVTRPFIQRLVDLVLYGATAPRRAP
jgi:AcrR family transcriptional regulator